MAAGPPFAGPSAPSDVDLSRCVHCGLCLPHCPTYTETGLETESPRGRLYLIKAITEERIDATPTAIGHLDLCLQCRNCEAVCPSGVPYGRIMEGARAEILTNRPALGWRLRAFLLRHVIARPGRMAALAALLRLYRASGLRWLAERVPLLRERVILAPTIHGRSFRGSGVLAAAEGTARGRVALLTGCIMPHAFGRVHEATVRVLARNGFEVVAPPSASSGCCGALHAHNGDRSSARALARRNIDACLAAEVDIVVVNSAGCGSAMKEYGELLADDPDYAEKGGRLAAKVRDVTELLAELPMEAPRGRVEADVTYQDACHLAHAQRITGAPRELLAAIPGLRLVEMAQPDRCCGSAGIYSLAQREMSLALLDGKMRDIAATGAGVIATTNPGCMIQLEAGLRRRRMPGRVVHVVELLDEAYRRADEGV